MKFQPPKNLTYICEKAIKQIGRQEGLTQGRATAVVFCVGMWK